MRNLTSIPLIIVGAALVARYPGANLGVAYRAGVFLTIIASAATIGSM